MHTFYITRQNVQGSMVSKDPDGQSKRYLETYSIPSIDLIKDPRPHKKGRTWIANVAGELTPFVDEQSDPTIIQKIKKGEIKLPKLQFVEGRRNVEEDNLVEYEYLKLCSWNDVNKKNNRTRTFFEFKPQEISKRKVETEMEDIRIKSEILQLPSSKLKAVARVSGALASSKTFDSVDPSIIQHSLIVKVSTPHGKTLVEEILKDPLLEPRFDILEGIDKGEIMWHPNNDNNLVWRSGGVLVNVPAGTEDKAKYAADYLYNKGRETLNTLRNRLGRNTITKEQAASSNTELKKWVENATPTEVINKILDWNKENPSAELLTISGPYYYFGEMKLAIEGGSRGKDGVRDFLIQNQDAYNMVYQEWSKFVF